MRFIEQFFEFMWLNCLALQVSIIFYGFSDGILQLWWEKMESPIKLGMVEIWIFHRSNVIEKNEIDLNKRSNYASGSIFMPGTSHMASVSGVKYIGLMPSQSFPNNSRRSFKMENIWHAPTTLFLQSTHFHEPSRTISDFPSDVTINYLIPFESPSTSARGSL